MTTPPRTNYEKPIDVKNRNDWGIDKSRLPCTEASHIPGYFYTSPEIYELEKERIFFKDWLAVGRVEEIEKPGQYLARRMFDEPFIVARNDQGEIHAFYNRCAHRGVRVAEEDGTTSEFTCPYHGWLYDLNGQLIGVPHMREAVGFKKENCRLKSIAVGIWAGWIFINFDPEPMPFEEFIGPYDRQFGFLKQENCRLAEKLVLEVDCNWKFPAENLQDNYHTPFLHVKTIGPTVAVEQRFKGTRPSSTPFTAFYDAAPMTADSKSRFGRMPWLSDKSDKFACSAHIAPNFHLLARSDNVHPVVMTPVGVGHTRIECYQLFPAEWHNDKDFKKKLADYSEFTLALLKEDALVMESLHDAASSTKYEPGRCSHFELGVWNLINYNLDRVLNVGSRKLYE